MAGGLLSEERLVLGLLQLLLQVQEGCWQQQLVMLSASSAAI